MLGLSARRCQENIGNLTVLSEEVRELLRNQVPGWRVATSLSGVDLACIQQLWKLNDEEAAEQMALRVMQVAQQEGHADSLTLSRVGAEVTAQLCTASLGMIGPERLYKNV